ncbi:SGNH/GDSL hydrolase family protein [Gryllotalpicola reticulitermitis]|uniref:SGNH/GDSL hydrolase family protein n=1 Tax=Gryllotalpicola reticulitermitis TaxID=1184153 RepID=A0ABV8Q9Z3_9MICO
MRARSAIVAAGAVGLAVGAGLIWGRWLRRRQLTWQRLLADNIPVHSAYWRARRELPGDLVYIAIGDSAAQGIGASRPARSYVGVLAKRLEKRTGLAVRVVNLSISGATLGTAIEKELPRFLHIRSELVDAAVITVSVGANDIAAWDAERFERELDLLLSQLPPHAIVADLPSFYFLPGERKALAGNRILRSTAAKYGLRVVDLHDTMRREGVRGVTTQFAGDLFHPNDRGYVVWANAFEQAVRDRVVQLQDSVGSALTSALSQSRASTNTSSA